MPAARRLLIAELTVMAVAIILRLAALDVFESTAWSRHPAVDAYTYWDQARRLLDGRDPFADGYYQPPAYPVILAWFSRFTDGVDLAAIRRLHLVLGVLTTGGLIALGRRVGAALGWPLAGVVAGALYTLYPTTLLFEHDVLTPTISSAALVGALLLAWPPASAARSLLGGLAMGIAVAVHPTYLLAAGVLAAAQAWGRRWVAALAFVVGVGAPIAPTAIENLQRFGTPTLVSHNAGINLYLGNNPGWRTTAFLRPGLPFRKLALEGEPHRRDAAARDRYWRQRTWDEASAHPWVWVSTAATKAYWSLHDTEIPRNEDYRCRTGDGQALRWLRRLPVRYGLVLPLAVLGAAALARRRQGAPTGTARTGVWLIAAWVALHAPMVLFLVGDRYRLASWPVVCLLGAAGVAALASRPRPGPAWALLAIPIVLPWLPIDQRTARDPTLCRYAEGNLAYMEGDTDAAAAAYRDVLAERPEDMGSHNWLAHLAAADRRYSVALRHMDRVLAGFPDHFPSLKSAGRWAARNREPDRAIGYYERAYAVPGDRTSTGLRLVGLLLSRGRSDEASRILDADPKLQRRYERSLEKRRREKEADQAAPKRPQAPMSP